MGTSILPLDEGTIARIAAGEVIERPASVVKELVENSIDAGAHDIRVEIVHGGRRLVRVSDDGAGIPAAEIELAFQRHTTSKLRSADELTRVATLGFRGEALAAIAAVSQVTIISRPPTQDLAVRLRLEQGRVVSRTAVGSPPGTVLTAENLFHAQPARLKFLRSEATETGHVLQVVTRYALAYPERRFQLLRDGRLAFASTGSGMLADVLAAVYGHDLADHAVPLHSEPEVERHLRITGLVGPAYVHRSTRSHITILVNGRWIQDTAVAAAIIQAYQGLIPAGRYPVAVVGIDIAPEEVDINVHPAKTEVRFREPQWVFARVQQAVREAVRQASTTTPWGGPAVLDGSERKHLASWPPLPTASGGTDAAAVRDGLSTGYEQAPLAGEAGESLPILRVIGQLARSYIVAEGPQGLYIIDQHAAHERVLYEQLSRRRGLAASQPLLMPETVRLSPMEMVLLSEHMEAFQAIGFMVEPFGSDTVIVRAVPEGLSTMSPGGLLRGVIDGLSEDRDAVALAFEERLVRAICKQAAIKAGRILDPQEMRELVRQLENCAAPGTCPHGRPTRIVLDTERLAREFRRG